TPVRMKTKYNTRGLGWALMGLLSSHELLPEGGYLRKALAMSAHLVKHQAPDGHWEFNFAESSVANEASAKGTSLWAWLFYRLHAHTGDSTHLEAARKALRWCLAHRERGDDPNAIGGIADMNSTSGVVYRRWDKLVCNYTMAFVGLALLEELKLLDTSHPQGSGDAAFPRSALPIHLHDRLHPS